MTCFWAKVELICSVIEVLFFIVRHCLSCLRNRCKRSSLLLRHCHCSRTDSRKSQLRVGQASLYLATVMQAGQKRKFFMELPQVLHRGSRVLLTVIPHSGVVAFSLQGVVQVMEYVYLIFLHFRPLHFLCLNF